MFYKHIASHFHRHLTRNVRANFFAHNMISNKKVRETIDLVNEKLYATHDTAQRVTKVL